MTSKAPSSIVGDFKDVAAASFSPAHELHAFQTMLLIRRFEEKAGQLYAMGLIDGFCHLYIGQEAVAVGMQMAASPQDQIITSYRCHGHMLACGIDPQAVMAELTGRQSGVSKGNGGSIHMLSPEHGFFGGHGIVGANVPIGAGLAFANRYRGNTQVCLCTLGDGAADQGQVYEAFNLANRWSLPIVFVIENNRFAAGDDTPSKVAAVALSQRGQSFQIPGETIDGMDVRAVKRAGDRVLSQIRAGGGPRILELTTYRYRGHSVADPAKYRSAEETQKIRQEHDPIERARARILQQRIASEDELQAIDANVRDRVSQAAEFAQAEPEPNVSSLRQHVTADQ